MVIFYLVVFSFSPHIYIFCSVDVVLSMYCMFVRCIPYFVHCPKKSGLGSLKITLFKIKNILVTYILTLLILSLFFPLSSKLQISQVSVPIKRTPNGMMPVKHGNSTSTVLLIWSERPRFSHLKNRNTTTTFPTWTRSERGGQWSQKREMNIWVNFPRWHGTFIGT